MQYNVTLLTTRFTDMTWGGVGCEGWGCPELVEIKASAVLSSCVLPRKHTFNFTFPPWLILVFGPKGGKPGRLDFARV